MLTSRWSWPWSTMTSDDLELPDLSRRHAGRERAVDVLALLSAIALGVLFVIPELRDHGFHSTTRVAVDILAGALACASLFSRRRWPVGVAVACLLLGTVSSSATPAGLIALTSLAMHRPARSVVLVGLLWIPSLLAYAAYSPTTGPVPVLLFVMPLVFAASGWGMFVRARRQLLLSLRERALRAEANQQLREERARVAERTRIAREMHDVLAHRVSLMALHAGGLELRPDLPADEVRETAALLRTTAVQALEELRGVIGVLREEPAHDQAASVPQPRLRDVPLLVEETRMAGANIELAMLVEPVDGVPAALGRDAYRIVQEALTNIGKHARGTPARVRVTGAPNEGLHVSVRNRQPVVVHQTSTLPGAGAGLVGLGERVALAGGTLTSGPDGTGDFVVEADLPW